MSNEYTVCVYIYLYVCSSDLKRDEAGSRAWAKANGSAEYIPAALSLYETNLSTYTTGCTDVAFVIPMNKTAAYIDPIALDISC